MSRPELIYKIKRGLKYFVILLILGAIVIFGTGLVFMRRDLGNVFKRPPYTLIVSVQSDKDPTRQGYLKVLANGDACVVNKTVVLEAFAAHVADSNFPANTLARDMLSLTHATPSIQTCK